MKKGSLFTDVLQAATKYFGFLIAIVVIGILCSGIRIIESGNQAIILRMGKIVGDTYEEQVHGPGLLLAFPYIIDEVIVIPTDQVFQQNVIVHDSGESTGKTSKTGYVMTGDNNIAVVAASVKYTVSDPVKYALRAKDISAIIDASVSSAMVRESAAMEVDSLLTDQKDSFTQAIFRRASEKLAEVDVGVALRGIELTKVAMPEEVRGIYDQVNAASVQVSTMLSTAKQYQEKVLPAAHADADTIVSQAESAYSQRIATANQELAEFWGVLEEYKSDPDGVKARIYSQKVSQIMDKIGTVRVVSDGDTNLFLNPAIPGKVEIPTVEEGSDGKS